MQTHLAFRHLLVTGSCSKCECLHRHFKSWDPSIIIFITPICNLQTGIYANRGHKHFLTLQCTFRSLTLSNACSLNQWPQKQSELGPTILQSTSLGFLQTTYSLLMRDSLTFDLYSSYSYSVNGLPPSSIPTILRTNGV
jgi:hypothetical protein